MADRQRVKELLERAAGLRPEERGEFLRRECGGDAALRREVEELLDAAENSPHLARSSAFFGEDEDVTRGAVLGGRYVIEGKLGEGGMGQVYLARELGIPRQVAIKIFEKGFAKEVEALARVRSDRVVKIFNTGTTDDGRPYMVMEYLPGQKLSDLLRQRGPLPHVEVAQLVRQMAEAAAELHETKPSPGGRGIIHRDLKPSNIMVEQRRGAWEVKLFDLGIARLHNPQMGKSTSRHVAIGTPLYMAPEQFHGEAMADFGCRPQNFKEIISPATDIYALGVIAYEMLAGHHPFRGAAGPANVAAMQRESRYADVLSRRDDIPPAARAVILKAMAFCPEARYQNAEEFGRAFAEAMAAPQPNPEPEPKPKPLIRYAAAAALLLALLVAGGFMLMPSGGQRGAGEDRPVADGGNVNSGRGDHVPEGGGVVEGSQPDARTPISRLPEREVTYWLVTQQMRGERAVGEPRVITAEEGIVGGWNFKVYFESGERGYLYLINDGPTPEGKSLQILFPIPNDPNRSQQRNDGTSEVLPGRAVEAFEGVVGTSGGTERLWLVWAAERIPQLERLTAYANERHEGRVPAGDAEAARAFLSGLRQAEVKYDERGRAVLRGAGIVLAKELLLRHV